MTAEAEGMDLSKVAERVVYNYVQCSRMGNPNGLYDLVREALRQVAAEARAAAMKECNGCWYCMEARKFKPLAVLLLLFLAGCGERVVSAEADAQHSICWIRGIHSCGEKQ